MAYKKKLIVLLSIIAVLALTYTASLVFDPETVGSRSTSYYWLDSKAAARISGIAVSAPTAEPDYYDWLDEESVPPVQRENWELNRTNNRWFVSYNGKSYPARQLRVEDFVSILTTRASYPVRSSDAASHSRLGLDEETASRVTVRTENGVILDLLLGAEDITGREIYLRKYGQNEVRSGDNKFGLYITGSVSSWYNLRLFPETEDGGLDVDGVQRLSVYGQEESQVFSRSNREWIISGITVENPDQNSVDSYVRAILTAEGEDFIVSISGDDPVFNHSRIVLELGDGSVKTIRLTEPDESGRLLAHVSGSEYIYSLASWSAQRLFRAAADFEKQ